MKTSPLLKSILTHCGQNLSTLITGQQLLALDYKYSRNEQLVQSVFRSHLVQVNTRFGELLPTNTLTVSLVSGNMKQTSAARSPGWRSQAAILDPDWVDRWMVVLLHVSQQWPGDLWQWAPSRRGTGWCGVLDGWHSALCQKPSKIMDDFQGLL